jgi:hypothetical protein
MIYLKLKSTGRWHKTYSSLRTTGGLLRLICAPFGREKLYLDNDPDIERMTTVKPREEKRLCKNCFKEQRTPFVCGNV